MVKPARATALATAEDSPRRTSGVSPSDPTCSFSIGTDGAGDAASGAASEVWDDGCTSDLLGSCWQTAFGVLYHGIRQKKHQFADA